MMNWPVFLNRLPITGDRSLWMNELRLALLELMDDVDRVAININVYCDPIHPPKSHAEEISVRFSSNGTSDGLAISHSRRFQLPKNSNQKQGSLYGSISIIHQNISITLMNLDNTWAR